MTKTRWVLGISTCMVLLSGCGNTAAATGSSAETRNATVVVALAPDSPPNWFVPVFSASAYIEINAQIQFLMYRPLIYLNKNSQVDYSRSLVSHIAVNTSGTTYTLTLNHKYAWSNGAPVTAQDVVFTWDLIKDASAPDSPWPYGAEGSGGVPNDWKSVTAQGSNTVVVQLRSPANPQWFIHNGLSQISPIPKAIWDKYPNNEIKELRYIQSVANSPTNSVYHVVDGPFQFKSWQPNNYWELVPNPKFGGHQASIGKLIFQDESSSANEFAGLHTGAISVGYLPPSMWKSRGELSDDVMTSSYLFGTNYIIPNLNAKAPGGLGTLFSKLYIRQALEMGINQKGIVGSLYHGAGVMTDGPVPSKPKTIYIDTALAKFPYPYNPAKGKALLERHGWHDVNGVMTRQGRALRFNLIYGAGSPTETDMVSLIKAGWAQEGIDVSLQQMPQNQVFAMTAQSDPSKWQMGYWGAGWTYQLDYYPTGGNLFATSGGENASGYNNATLDQLIQDTYELGTPAQIRARMDAYQQFAAIHLPVLWVPWLPMGYARVAGYNEHARNVHGTVKTFNPVTDYLYANYWTVSNN
ncbi:MAG: peptide ABC transporter substrate-binding protein [Sulfobacillus thermotolerans]|uniref:ABC transporter substrate-binding protein n=1 Tax=Sulfobacillus thermotolerans TaxID=338644 RepID=A0ABN5H012_9FIRM|nr:ABC transporter substrate-binding protein [Sulfobacillus thermotolerans]MCY0907753.1 peptide ABC transporter substrate-binding protein [Sulfobacillus thermotolerans]